LSSSKEEDLDVVRLNRQFCDSLDARFLENGTCEPMPRGGSTSPLEKDSWKILALISEQPDLTLDEMVTTLHKRRIPGSRCALSRFFARHGITVKKKPAGGRAQASRRSSCAPTLDSRARPS
jgi:transposase